MAAPVGQAGWEPIPKSIDWCGIAFVILFGKTDDCEEKKRKKKKKKKKENNLAAQVQPPPPPPPSVPFIVLAFLLWSLNI